MGTSQDKPAGKSPPKDARDKPRAHKDAHKDEIEVAYYTKELGRPLQRKMLQNRLDDFSHSHIHAASHGEDTSQPEGPPREDRAG